MNSRLLLSIAACVLVLSLLSACQSGVSPIAAAADYDFEARRISAPDCRYGGNLRSIQAVDRYTVRFTLCEPDPALPSKLAYPAFAILDEAYLETLQGDSELMDALPNGTGPYTVREWLPVSGITLEPNPYYWGPPVNSQVIEFGWAALAETRQKQILSGEVDGIDRPAPRDLHALQANAKLDVYTRPSLHTFYIGMNNNFSPFDKAKVRQAIAMGIDRRQLLDALAMPDSQLADQFLSPLFTPGYTPGYRWYDFDPKGAYELLRAAEFDFVRPILLAYPASETEYLAEPSIAAENIRAQLGAIGVQVTLLPMHPEDFQKSVLAGQQAFFLYGWTGNYPDAYDFYQSHFTSDNLLFGSPYPDLEFMVKQVANAYEERDRQYRYNRINEIIRMHVPAIPVAHASSAIVMDKEVQNVLVGPLNENFEEMSTPDDRLRFIQSAPPVHLWPGEHADNDTLRVARLIYDSLLRFEFGGTEVAPNLAEYWESNREMTEWTFYLRYGVRFADGAELDANDVVATFAMMWDAANPAHKGEFESFERIFGAFLNAAE